MNLSINKCLAFEIVTKKDTWFITEPNIKIENNIIPNAEPDTIFRYLGAKLGPWKGLHQNIVVPDVIQIIKRIRKLYLKPQQKIDLITTYLLPKFTYGLLMYPPSNTVLKLLDSEIRQQAKEILHLTPSTATGFFYTPKLKGGLGLPKYEHIIKLATLRNAVKMKCSADPAVSSIITPIMEEKLKFY